MSPAIAFSFVVEGPPIPKARPRVHRGKAYTPERTRSYEQLVRSICSLRRPPGWRVHGSFRAGLRFYVRSSSRADLDNLAKSVLDAMNKIAYWDDRMVVGFDELERYVDNARPRAEITVRRVG